MGITREHDGDDLRWYVTEDGVRAFSVTQVLGMALEEDKSGLEYWKKNHQGDGDSFHHHHIYWYSAPRGTLCHYQALKKFEDQFDTEDDMWGEEEAESMAQVLEGPTDEDLEDWPTGCSSDMDDIVYSILKNQNVVESREQYRHLFKGSTRLIDILKEDTDYFVEGFNAICDELGVTSESVIRVEKFMVETEHGYGGQTDMVYEDPSGDTVVVDLKTSSSLRQKHRLQGVAYMKAVEHADWGPDEIDRIEVWRIDPDDEEWQVHSHTVPEHVEHLYDEESPEDASYTDEYWFEDKWGDFEYDSVEDMWDTFKELVDTAHEQAHGRTDD